MHDDRIAFDDTTLRLAVTDEGVALVDTLDADTDIQLVEWWALDMLIEALQEIRNENVESRE